MIRNFLMLLFLSVMFTSRANAVFGVGDISFDPTTYAEVAALYKKTVEMYDTAKQNLDKLASVEKTIREAQQAYDTLSKFDMQQAAKGLKPGNNSTASFAALRGQIANTEGKLNQNSSFVKGNLARISQLENLEILKRASLTNLDEASGAPNQATSAKVTAQSVAALAALAAAEEQRRIEDDIARSQGGQLEKDNFKNAKKVYEAMGK